MSNLYKENKDVKVTCSPFAIYPNEIPTKEKKRFNFSDIHHEKIRPIDIELLYALHQLKYATSRQLTEFLNNVRGIDVHQKEVSNMLLSYQKIGITLRYSFISDLREKETSSKVYALADNGKNILKSTPFGCNLKRTDTEQVLYIKHNLAKNQFMLKLIEIISNISWNTKVNGILSSYTFNNSCYYVLPVRRTSNFSEELKIILANLREYRGINQSDKIVIVGEDDKHLYDIFKFLVINKLMNPNILFTQDNRIFTLDISECFIKFNITKVDNKPKVELEQCGLV